MYHPGKMYNRPNVWPQYWDLYEPRGPAKGPKGVKSHPTKLKKKACTVFARSEPVIVGVCAFFCVCVQVEALRRADQPPKESYRMFKI
jgi:hypothetical protein